MEQDDIVRALRECFESAGLDLAAVYLFGSAARGESGPDSDVDIALLYRHEPPSSFAELPLRLEGHIESTLGRPVQLVVINGAPLPLVHRILQDGILVREPDRSARISFEVEARRKYLDLLPFLRRYWRLPESAA